MVGLWSLWMAMLKENALEHGATLWLSRVMHLVKHKMSHEGLEDKEEEEILSFFALAPS